MSRAKKLRRARYGQAAAQTLNAGNLAFEALRGNWFLAAISAVCVVALAVAIWVQTKAIRRREYLDRPRPDYALIARMEREVYGEAFRHEGSIASVFLRPPPRTCPECDDQRVTPTQIAGTGWEQRE